MTRKDLLIYDRKLEKGSGPPIYGLEVRSDGIIKDFISFCQDDTITNYGEEIELLNTNKSHYNSQIIMDQCSICNSKDGQLETHHINEQQNADKNNMLDHYHKNKKHNLVPLCKSCHQKVTFGQLRIYGYIQTNEGIKLNYDICFRKEPNM